MLTLTFSGDDGSALALFDSLNPELIGLETPSLSNSLELSEMHDDLF